MQIDAHGWLEGGGRCVRSPHCDDRPEIDVDLVVVHHISLPPGCYGGPEIEALFCGQLDCAQHPALADLSGLRVSSHFLIRRTGELVQFVSVHDRAWHAGVSEFRGRQRCNDFSVGVELEGSDRDAFEPIQYDTLLAVCVALKAANPHLAWIAGHSDIAPGRKTDPGPHFDWGRVMGMLADHDLPLQRPFR